MKQVCAKCGVTATMRCEVKRIKHTGRERRYRWWAPMIRRRYSCDRCMPAYVRELKARGMRVQRFERIGVAEEGPGVRLRKGDKYIYG